jgi:drug/metabolite transporter (DMT)-like permease
VSQTFKVHSVLTAVALIYSINFSVTKAVTPAYVLPFGLVGLRVIFGSALLWIFHRLAVREPVANRRDYFLLFLCGQCGISINQLLFVKGLSITNPINASLLITVTPILVMLISAIALREPLTRTKILGLLLGATGTVLLLSGKDFSFNTKTLAGDLILLASTVFFSTYLVLVKPLSARYQATTITKWAFLFGAIPVIPFSMPQIRLVDWPHLPTGVWAALAFILLGATFLVYLLNNWTLQHVTPSVVGIYIYLQPVLASLIAVGLGKDSLTMDKVLFGIVILSGVYLVGKK